MDYLAELKAYYDWLDTNPLEPTTQTLWFHLMELANKSGCPEWFTVANPLLQAKIGVTENTLNKHRNYLVQRGRIEYRSMGKQKAGKYKIVWFTSKNAAKDDVKQAVNYAAHHEENHDVKHAVLLKEFKISSSSSSSSQAGESFYTAHKRVFGFDCNPFQAQKLAAYIDQDGMQEDLVIHGLERAAEASTGYKFRFIEKILDDYFKAGIRSLSEAIQFDARYAASTQSGGGSRAERMSKEMEELRQAKEEAMRREGVPIN